MDSTPTRLVTEEQFSHGWTYFNGFDANGLSRTVTIRMRRLPDRPAPRGMARVVDEEAIERRRVEAERERILAEIEALPDALKPRWRGKLIRDLTLEELIECMGETFP